MNFGQESLRYIFHDLQPLLRDHYAELTLNKDKVRLDPDWAQYDALEAADKLRIYTARDLGELVGYAFFFVTPHIHYRKLTVATNDVLFLKSEYRKGMTGIRFLKYCEQELFKCADKVTWHVKAAVDFGPILQRMGYSHEDTIMGKHK